MSDKKIPQDDNNLIFPFDGREDISVKLCKATIGQKKKVLDVIIHSTVEPFDERIKKAKEIGLCPTQIIQKDEEGKPIEVEGEAVIREAWDLEVRYPEHIVPAVLMDRLTLGFPKIVEKRDGEWVITDEELYDSLDEEKVWQAYLAFMMRRRGMSKGFARSLKG